MQLLKLIGVGIFCFLTYSVFQASSAHAVNPVAILDPRTNSYTDSYTVGGKVTIDNNTFYFPQDTSTVNYFNFPSRNFGQAFSVSTWMNTSNMSCTIEGIFTEAASGLAPNGFKFYMNNYVPASPGFCDTGNGPLATEAGNGTNGDAKFTSVSVITKNKWFHVVWTFDTSTGYTNIFLNGNLLTTQQLAYIPTSTTGSYRLGAFTDGTFQYFGRIGVTKIYNSVMSTSEVNTDLISSSSSYWVSLSGTLSTTGNKTSFAKNAITPIIATLNGGDGKVTFYVNGKAINHCINLQSISYVATCNWRPVTHGNQIISAAITSNSAFFSNGTVSAINLSTIKRTTNR